MPLFDILILASYLAEVTLLTMLECKLWGTIYTPLNFLMLPSTVVMLVCVCCVPVFGLYPFFFPSLFVWEAGLALFFLPSLFFSQFYDRTNHIGSLPKFKTPAPNLLFWGVMAIIALYFLHLRSTLATSAAGLGSDQFADENKSGGLWGHLFVLVYVSEIISFCYISRKRWYFIIPILLGILVCVLNQVKGWLLIPLVTGLLTQIFTGRLRITLRLILLTLLGGAGFFFLSYYLTLVVSENKEITDDFLFFILKNFFHYLSSGFLGLSMDCDMGIVEEQSVDYLFTPFLNMYNVLAGNEMLTNLNTHYFCTSWPGLQNNIRSFMGTIYVFGGPWFFAPIVMLFSSIAYLFRILLLRKPAIHWLLIDAWLCAILFMGWFDYYFALLQPLEVIVLFLVFGFTLHFLKLDSDVPTPQQA